jgi:oligopeptide/dipeptide ABC transporter ATP-binding protein
MQPAPKPVLSVRELQTYFFTDAGVARAVDGVSFDVYPGRTLALVGESGCGKSITALSILRLVPSPPGRIVAGSILFEGEDLLMKNPSDMRDLRGNDISMIFQEPMTSLNPVFRVGDQIGGVLRLHRGLSKRGARAAAVELLDQVGIADPQSRVDDYPHQMSGGMRQRVMIAMALACDPKVLIADEPTTALDVTIQAQILELLKKLQRERGMAIILITHDLGVVAEAADDVAIMYAGRIAELAPVRELFANRSHPYTEGLFESLPEIGAERARLNTIKGNVPPATHFPNGCRFHPRCPYVMRVCPDEEPGLIEVAEAHTARCWLHHIPTMTNLAKSAKLTEAAAK